MSKPTKRLHLESGQQAEDRIRSEVQLRYGFYSPKAMTIRDLSTLAYILTPLTVRKDAAGGIAQGFTLERLHAYVDSRLREFRVCCSGQKVRTELAAYDTAGAAGKARILCGWLGFMIVCHYAGLPQGYSELELDSRGGTEISVDAEGRTSVRIRVCEIKARDAKYKIQCVDQISQQLTLLGMAATIAYPDASLTLVGTIFCPPWGFTSQREERTGTIDLPSRLSLRYTVEIVPVRSSGTTFVEDADDELDQCILAASPAVPFASSFCGSGSSYGDP